MLPIFIPTDPIICEANGWRPPPPAKARGEAISDRFRAGVLTSTPIEGGPAVQADILSCIHCGFTWVPAPGSGRLRGFCGKCNGYVCGRHFCTMLGCVHRERIIENLERGRPLNFNPIIVSVPDNPFSRKG